ncbi:MAG: pyridoxamine 5'-phosphate oxidase family protein [Anaerolineales bacterium]
MTANAKSSRPFMPGYGIAPENEGAGLLPWPFVEERMEKSRNYWVSSVTLGKQPHVAPVWGLWHAGAFYFSTGAESQKGRNFAANPAATVHLESGDEAVILEGEVEAVKDQDLLKALDKSYEKKYGMGMQGPGLIFHLKLQRAFAWREADFPNSATRWVF